MGSVILLRVGRYRVSGNIGTGMYRGSGNIGVGGGGARYRVSGNIGGR